MSAQLHFDAETGEFWDEGGGSGEGAEVAAGAEGAHGGGGKGGGKGVGKGGGRPSNPALQRRRDEAQKAKVANHSRKAAAARKQQRAGGF